MKKILEYYYNDPNSKELIADLKTVIDEIGYTYTKFNEIIKKLASHLYEDGICERDKISQVIKYILIDKIKEGKISKKWIEQTLPNEYKRKYAIKSERCSLSNDNQLNNERDSLLFQDSKEIHRESIKQTIENEPKYKIKNFDQLEHNGCNLCRDVISENIELKEALQKTNKFLSAQRLKNEINIPREKYNAIISEIKKNNSFLNIKFEIDGNILSIKSIMEATTTDIMKNNQGH